MSAVAAQRMSLCLPGDSICIVTQHRQADRDGVRGGYVVATWPGYMCWRSSASAAAKVRPGIALLRYLYTSLDNMPMTRKARPQSARLDILALMTAGGSSDKQRPASPADSLSPCRGDFAFDAGKMPRSAGEFDRRSEHAHIATANEDARSGSASSTGPDDDDWFVSEPACPPLSGKSQLHQTSTTPSVQTPTTSQHEQEQEQLAAHVRLPKHATFPATRSHTSLPTPLPRCLLSRSCRPSTISVDETNGASTLPAYELKQAIKEAGPANDILQPVACNSPPSSPERGRPRHRRSPAQLTRPSFDNMGNQHSHHESTDDGAFDQADDRSAASVLRASRLRAARIPRRSSMNVFKRLDSKSPLPADLSGTVIEVPRAATAPNLDDMADDDQTEDEDRERSRARHAHRHSAPSPSIPMHPASPTATLTEESAARPLSATGTITDRRRNTEADDSIEDDSPLHLCISALSPTLPAPSPIPEDSPHKYGLKDRMDTPEANTPPPPDAELAKARRRSSGLAIFNVGICSTPLFAV